MFTEELFICLYSSIILILILILGSHPTWQKDTRRCRLKVSKVAPDSVAERTWKIRQLKGIGVRFCFAKGAEICFPKTGSFSWNLKHWWQRSWSSVGNFLLPTFVVAGITSRWVSNFWLWMVRKWESWQRQLSGFAEVWEMKWDRTDRLVFLFVGTSYINSQVWEHRLEALYILDPNIKHKLCILWLQPLAFDLQGKSQGTSGTSTPRWERKFR